MDGIYILGNDAVFDQVIALVNSIQAHNGDRYPICIVPYDDRVDRIREKISGYSGVTVFDDVVIMKRWEDFVFELWDQVPQRYDFWGKGGTHSGVHRLGAHRRFVAFDSDSPFSRFVYLDADTLALSPLDKFFTALDTSDFVTYDFQYKDPGHVFNVNLEETLDFLDTEDNGKKIFCTGMFASRNNIITEEKRRTIIESLKAGGSRILYPSAPVNTTLNYILITLGLSYSNLGVDLPKEERTGCCVTSDHFVERDWQLYDKGVLLTYLHYIGMSGKVFARLCSGENVGFPYRDLFLHYRYLKTPEELPKLKGRAVAFNAPPSLLKRVKKKIGAWI
ncbi:MAG: Npun_R2821/Npun_R2822 family protein [Cyanophyceae cyanobacterium]